jgi:hypothetical protein
MRLVMTLQLIGVGVFSWHKNERVSNRYGAFFLGMESYNGDKAVSYTLHDMDKLTPLIGKRVKVVATVVENRKSGHVGDFFLGVGPTMPQIDDTIEIGVGTLDFNESEDHEPKSWSQFILEPNDGRSELWMDPRKLYNLHDQTVEIWMEETDQDFSCKPDLTKPT